MEDKQTKGSLRRLPRVSIYLTRLFLLILIIVIEGRKRGFSNSIERAAKGGWSDVNWPFKRLIGL